MNPVKIRRLFFSNLFRTIFAIIGRAGYALVEPRHVSAMGAQKKTNCVSLDRPLVVVDVGCRWGFAEKFTLDADHFRVYGFDPDKEECARLTKLYEAGGAVTLIPFGLAGSPGKRTLYVTKDPACSSLLEPNPELTEYYPSLHCARRVLDLEVVTTTLDHWAKDAGIEVVDYIKIDTQGTELEILQGGTRVLEHVRCLEVEVEFNPIYLGQPLFADIDTFLRSRGFVLWKLTNHVHYSKAGLPGAPLGEDAVLYDNNYCVRHATYGGQLYWANAHYINKDVLQHKHPSDPLISRDVALFEVLGMPDVVQHLHAQN